MNPAAALLSSHQHVQEPRLKEGLQRWRRIFAAIGRTWKNTYHDSAGLKSSWLEFVAEKTLIRPSYVAEYVNALEVVNGDDARQFVVRTTVALTISATISSSDSAACHTRS